MKQIKKLLLSFLKKYIQRDYLKRSIEIKGNYTIEEDKIIYTIHNNDLRKSYQDKSFYKLRIFPIKIDPKLKRSCQLDKPIEYRFENINFEKPIEISEMLPNITLHFKNCTFTDQMIIYFADRIILENNHYYNAVNVYYAGDSFFSVIGYMNHLMLVNDNFSNSSTIWEHSTSKPHFGMHLKQIDQLEIINSNITASELGTIRIEKAKTCLIKNSTITAPKISIKADKIENPNSSIIATKEIIIENKENNSIENIQAPSIIYNGTKFPHAKEVQSINQEKIELQQARQHLIRILKNYQKECKEYLETKILPEITVASVSKGLKRKKEGTKN